MATTNLSLYDPDDIPNAENFRFGIVVSEWNNDITDGLYTAALATLLEHGALEENIISVKVPGSFELIYGCKRVFLSGE